MPSPVRGPGLQAEESELSLGPDLSFPLFTSSDPWHPERIGALALYCSDGRWGEAFDEFCHKCLQIPRYDRWAVPGGPSWLAAQDDGAGFFHAAREQLDFLVRVHELERLVLITHYGCAAYTHRLERSPEACLPVQLEDLQLAAGTLKGWYPHMRVEGYLAMRQGLVLSFHEVKS